MRNTHSLFSAVLAIESFVLIAALTSAHQLQATMTDISATSYEGQAAMYLQKKGIINGFPDGTFRGSSPVNRAQAAKMLLLAAEYSLSHLENDSTFPDIEKGSWYEQFALNAVEKGLMNGYPNGTFGPSKTVLRAEFLKMLTNAFEVTQHTPYHYVDVPKDAWYAQYAGPAEEYNLFLHDKEQLIPSAPMSREEVSWAIYQMVVYKKHDLTIRTPFDFVHHADPKLPVTAIAQHSAAPESSNATSESSTVSSTGSSSSVVTSSSEGSTTSETCMDTDRSSKYPNGLNQQKKGTTTNTLMPGPNNSYDDFCLGDTNILYEYYCNEEGYLAREKINCVIGCNDGACTTKKAESSSSSTASTNNSSTTSATSTSSTLSTSSTSSSEIPEGEEPNCIDSDATHRFFYGENVYLSGTTNGLLQNGSTSSFSDACIDATNLREFFCQTNGVVAELQAICPLGCVNGACVSPGATGTCTDTDLNSTFPEGKNFQTVGRIFVNHPEEGKYTDEDYCKSEIILNEFVCRDGGRVGRYFKECACEEGACKD